MINGKIVRALDVGYGNVKFVKKHEFIEDMVSCDMFPSKSPAATEGDIGAGTLKPRDTVFIEINKVRYEVGYDVTLAQGANDESGNFSKDFVRSDGYMARVLGALHYMFQSIEPDYIDTLVVGLPVNNMQAKHYLKDKLKTKHTLPNGREITIKDVRVFEQPLGAFFNFMYSTKESHKLQYSTAKDQTNLIIDAGMYTFDWLLVNGMKGNNNRSGATNRAMSDVIKVISKAVGKEYDTNETQVFKIIDNAIRSGLIPKVFKKDIDLDDYIKHASTVIAESVDAMFSSTGDGADIDNIILVGGGARFFYEAVKAKFPRHEIITSNNSVYANVIGFQLAVERAFLTEQVNSRKTALAA